MRKALVWASALALAALAGGCGLGRDRAEAEQAADAYFEAVRAGDLERATRLFSPDFFRQTPLDRWLTGMGSLRGKLGDLQGHQLVNWNIHKRVGAGGGAYCQLQYQVTYSRHPAQETLLLVRPTGGQSFRISGHHIVSEALFLE